MKTPYCSKRCQSDDWENHKKSCMPNTNNYPDESIDIILAPRLKFKHRSSGGQTFGISIPKSTKIKKEKEIDLPEDNILRYKKTDKGYFGVSNRAWEKLKSRGLKQDEVKKFMEQSNILRIFDPFSVHLNVKFANTQKGEKIISFPQWKIVGVEKSKYAGLKGVKI